MLNGVKFKKCLKVLKFRTFVFAKDDYTKFYAIYS